MSHSFQSHALKHTRLPCCSPSAGVCSDSGPLSRDAIQPSHPISSPSPPVLHLSQHQGLSSHLILCKSFLQPSILSGVRVFSNESAFLIRWPKYGNFNFSISPSSEYSELISFRIHWFTLPAIEGTHKSSPASQFKSINSLAPSLLYGPALTSIHEYWLNHSFDYTDLCWQSNVCAF